MEDFENYKIFFYILIAILYFLFSGKKKPKSEQKNIPPVKEVIAEKTYTERQGGQLLKKEEPVKKVTENKPVSQPYTLEDVLKEFGNTIEAKPEKSTMKRTPELEVLENFKPTIIDYDEGIVDEEEAESLEQNRGEITIPGQDNHFKEYSVEKKRSNKYADLLKTKEGLKTAFIAQEILNRKHF